MSHDLLCLLAGVLGFVLVLAGQFYVAWLERYESRIRKKDREWRQKIDRKNR